MVDVETDGPCPGLYSMIELGCVVVEPKITCSFQTQMCPVGLLYDPEAMKVSGITRAAALTFAHPEIAMTTFAQWIASVNKGKRAYFVSDNNGFDWQFVNYYFHRFVGSNPFGHSSTNLGSLYKGLVKDSMKNFKHLRQTAHTHRAVEDAQGNAEALLHMIDKMGLVFPL